MKKILAYLTLLCSLFCFVACASNTEETNTSPSSSISSSSSSKKKEDKSKEEKKKAEEAKKQEEAKKAEEARKAEEAKKLLENAESSVKNLEANQVSENIAGAEENVNKITDPAKKEELHHRIELVKNAINQRAEEARKQAQGEQSVQALEGNQVAENIAPAQEAVNQITDEGKKQELQTRINAVQNAINVRAAEAQRQQEAAAAAQAAAQQPAQAGGGYFKDYRGRWHRPNGQYASKAEIAAAGLQW